MGFVYGGSCNNAIFIMRSVIECLVEYGSNIYAATLEFVKA